MKRITPETALKKSCRDFLALYRVWTFPLVATMGSPPGLPDRIGIYKGKPLAIEFKSKRGQLTPSQTDFRRKWEAEGGLYILCRSVEDLASGLGIKTLGII